MKKLFLLLILTAMTAAAAAQTPRGIPWYDGKYSMFIHFGLYSELGGVWNGEPVKKGYSEQIQSWGGIQKDLYEEVAGGFNPVEFNADSIVALARAAGMRSIVITSKHHDGFCLWHTATTGFNMYDATPARRDLIAELADACRRGGIAVGLYYSLIDWHEPCADHITTHNATFITPEHHRFNMRQVEELVTRYGDISELWFDMGSLTPQQSRDLYELVRRHQKNCMISGRLGNGWYDFSVMGDNYYPSESVSAPWQSPASMFDATWGYRSWQERGSSHEKAQEKLRSLIRVVSGGGNFLLNIGPSGNGSVVPFERDVLLEIGRWLAANGDAIYGTSPSPYPAPFPWGAVTRSGSRLCLILSGTEPSDGVITLPVRGHRLLSASGPASVTLRGGVLQARLNPGAYSGDIRVIRITLDSELLPETSVRLGERIPSNSYFCQDYYTNAVSTVSYTWNIRPRKAMESVSFTHTASDIGRTVEAAVDGASYSLTLDGSSPSPMASAPVTVKDREACLSRKADFGSFYNFGKETWTAQKSDSGMFSASPMRNFYVRETVASPVEQDVIFEVGAGGGLEVYLNGETVVKHLNPYRCKYLREEVVLHLKAGDNTVILRAYNRFENTIGWMLRVSPSQTLYTSTLQVPRLSPGEVHTVTVRDALAGTPHEDCRLHNLTITNNR